MMGGGIPVNAFAVPPAISEDALSGATFASSSSEPPVRIRQKFPETWLWDSVDSGYEIQLLTLFLCSLLQIAGFCTRKGVFGCQ